MEREKREKAQRVANSHLLQTLENLIDSPVYEVLGQPYEAGKTVRVRKNVYTMPILCFSSAAEECVPVGRITINVKIGAILSCSAREEILRALADMEERVWLVRIHASSEDDHF